MGIRLIGKRDTRRTEYFLKAAEQCHIPVGFVDWDEVDLTELAGDVVKLDPPSYQTADLFELNERIAEYRRRLAAICEAGCRFLNPPAAIENVLDKRICKKALTEQGVPVTQMLCKEVANSRQLWEEMEHWKWYSVFIKPVVSSGAAGVVAYRKNPGNSREALYTSCCLRGGELVNTKRLFRMEDAEEIRRILDAVLSLGAIVERWYPKASYQGMGYDLRIVWQFDEAAFAVARQSRGPITNLHLNNAPLEIGRLDLPERTVEEIKEVCRRAMNVFPELISVGIDVLLEKDTWIPRIIEMNGQGDLMYQDIFRENRIYREQIRYMAQLAE